MTAVRVIPCLDIKEGRVVKGVQFEGLRDAGDPVELAKFYDSEGADELVFLDIGASVEGRATVIDLAKRVAEQVFIPFTIGGGIKTVDQMSQALHAGADKVSLNTAAIQNPDLIGEGARSFGSQCIVIAIDAKRSLDGRGWKVFTHGGRKEMDLDALDWARTVCDLGAGEILLTSMDGDGTLAGYDTELTRTISESVTIPVIASGGAGQPGHLIAAVKEGKADAVLVASIVHDGTYSIRELKASMACSGIVVRNV